MLHAFTTGIGPDITTLQSCPAVVLVLFVKLVTRHLSYLGKPVFGITSSRSRALVSRDGSQWKWHILQGEDKREAILCRPVKTARSPLTKVTVRESKVAMICGFRSRS